MNAFISAILQRLYATEDKGGIPASQVMQYMNTDYTEKEAACFLSDIKSLRPRDIRRLLSHFGTYSLAASGCPDDYDKLLTPAQTASLIELRTTSGIAHAYSELTRRNIDFYYPEDPLYPPRLLDISGAPVSLYVSGSLPRPDLPTVAIIGARNCSGYGRQMAREFSREIASAGIQIVSGMATGIDGIAEQAAFDVGGTSYGILGCGVDICFPESNRPLYELSIQKGGIISEYRPGTHPQTQFFPARNRIISGLADAVLVIESRERSGTQITVGMALEQGRDIYALPGRVNDSLSYGCNMLIRDGATPLIRPHEFVSEFLSRYQADFPAHMSKEANKNTEAITDFGEKFFLTSTERQIMSVLDYNPKSAGEVYYDLTESNVVITLTELLETLTNMTMHHKIRCIDGQSYCIG